jgi:hypothetical protein
MTAFGRNTRWRCFGSWAGVCPATWSVFHGRRSPCFPARRAFRLAVLPGTTHITLVHRVEWLTSMIAEFLDLPMLKDEPVP